MCAFPSYSEDDKARPSDTLAVLKKLLSLLLEQEVWLVVSAGHYSTSPSTLASWVLADARAV